MMGQTVEGCAGKQVIGKDLVEILGCLGRNGLQSEIVQDQQIASQDTSELAGVGSVRLGDLQIISSAAWGFGQDPEIAFQGFNDNGVSEMTFPHPVGPHTHKFLWRWMKTQEVKHFPIPEPADRAESLENTMESRGFSRSDLIAYLGSKERASEILNRKRGLSLEMIRRRHNGLGIPTDLIMGKRLHSATLTTPARTASHVRVRSLARPHPGCTGSGEEV